MTKLYTAREVLKLLPKGWRQFKIRESLDSDNVPVFRLRKRNFYFNYYGFHGPQNKHKWILVIKYIDPPERFVECVWGNPLQALYRGLRNFRNECADTYELLWMRADKASAEIQRIKKQLRR